MTIITKALIGKEDLQYNSTELYPTGTFARLNYLGGTSNFTYLPDIWKTHSASLNARHWNSGALTDTTISQAISAIGSNTRTLYLEPGIWVINNDLTIPSNINLHPDIGAIMSISSGKTLTINGPINAGLYQIFSGTGTVSGLKYAIPEWWGGKLDGTTDDSTADLAALASLSDGGVLEFSGISIFNVQLPVSVDGIALKGNGIGGLKLKANSGTVGQSANYIWIPITGAEVSLDGFVVDGNGTNQVRLSNVVSFGNGTGTTGIKGRASGNIFKDAYGTALLGWGTSDLRVYGNQFKDSTGAAGNPGEAFCASTVARLAFGHNIINTMADAGVYLTGTNSDINITNNDFYGCTNAATNVYGTQTGFNYIANTHSSCGSTPLSIDAAATVTKYRIYGNTDLADRQDVITVTPGDTTPNVSAGNFFYIANSAPTTIVNFEGAMIGSEITLFFADSNTTITRDNCFLAGGTNYTSAANYTLTLVKREVYWQEKCRGNGS